MCYPQLGLTDFGSIREGSNLSPAAVKARYGAGFCLPPIIESSRTLINRRRVMDNDEGACSAGLEPAIFSLVASTPYIVRPQLNPHPER